MKKFFFLISLSLMLLKSTDTSAQLFFAEDYPKLVMNSANVDAGTMLFLMYQTNVSYERFLYLTVLHREKDNLSLYYILNIRATAGFQFMPFHDGFTPGGNIAVVACNQLTNFRTPHFRWSIFPPHADYATQSIDIGIVKYFFGNPVITRSDILPVIYYTRTTYYPDWNFRFYFGFPYSAGLGIGLNF